MGNECSRVNCNLKEKKPFNHSETARIYMKSWIHSLHTTNWTYLLQSICMFAADTARMELENWHERHTNENEKKNNEMCNETNIRLLSNSLAACATHQICRQMPEQLTTLLTHQFKFSIVARILVVCLLARLLAGVSSRLFLLFISMFSSFKRNTHFTLNSISFNFFFVSSWCGTRTTWSIVWRCVLADVQFYCNCGVFCRRHCRAMQPFTEFTSWIWCRMPKTDVFPPLLLKHFSWFFYVVVVRRRNHNIEIRHAQKLQHNNHPNTIISINEFALHSMLVYIVSSLFRAATFLCRLFDCNWWCVSTHTVMRLPIASRRMHKNAIAPVPPRLVRLHWVFFQFIFCRTHKTRAKLLVECVLNSLYHSSPRSTSNSIADIFLWSCDCIHTLHIKAYPVFTLKFY